MELLSLLARFGHLRVSDVAVVFDISEQAARRSLNSGVRSKALLDTVRPDKTKVFGLSASGAKALSQSDPDLNADSALRYLRSLGNYDHRCRANEVALYYSDEYGYSTEFEIQSLRAPVKALLGKIPDALIYTPMGVVWIEIENSRRNRRSMLDLVRWFRLATWSQAGQRPAIAEDQDLWLLRVEFYCAMPGFAERFRTLLADDLGEQEADDLIARYAYFHDLKNTRVRTS